MRKAIGFMMVLFLVGCGKEIHNYFYSEAGVVPDASITDAKSDLDSRHAEAGRLDLKADLSDSAVADAGPDAYVPPPLPGEVRIRVLVDGSLIAGAKVWIESGKYGKSAMKTSDGFNPVIFPLVQPEIWTITAQQAGYQDGVTIITVVTQVIEEVKLTLVPRLDSGVPPLDTGPPDIGGDAPIDAGVDSSPDAGVDTSADASADIGADSAPDTGVDTTVPDAASADLDPNTVGKVQINVVDDKGKPVLDGSWTLTHHGTSPTTWKDIKSDTLTVMPIGQYSISAVIPTVSPPKLPFTKVDFTPKGQQTLTGKGTLIFTVTYTRPTAKGTVNISVVDENGTSILDGSWKLSDGLYDITGSHNDSLQVSPGTYTFSAKLPAENTKYASVDFSPKGPQALNTGATLNFEAMYQRKNASLVLIEIRDDGGNGILNGDWTLKRISAPVEDVISGVGDQTISVLAGTYELTAKVPSAPAPQLAFTKVDIVPKGPQILLSGSNPTLKAVYQRPAGAMTVDIFVDDSNNNVVYDGSWSLTNGSTVTLTGTGSSTYTLPAGTYTLTAVVPPGNTKYLTPTVDPSTSQAIPALGYKYFHVRYPLKP